MDNKKILTLLSSAHAVTHMAMGIVSVTLPTIMRELEATYTLVGLMKTTQGLAAGAGSAVGGLATDLVGRRKQLLILSMAWPTFFVFLGGFSPTFLFFAVCLILRDTLGGFLWHPPAMVTISDLYPGRRAFGFSVHEAGGNVGNAIGPLIAGFLLAYVGWRFLYLGYLLPGLAATALIWLFLPALGGIKKKKEGALSFRDAFKKGIMRNPRFVAITFTSGMRGASEHALVTFLPLFFAHNLNKSPAMIGISLFIMAISATLSAPFVGTLADRADRRLIIFLLMSLGGGLTYLITQVESNLIIFTLSILLGISIFSIRSVIIAFATDQTPPELGGTAVGFVFTFDRAFAAAIPLIAGYMGDLYGLNWSIYFLSACIILGGIVVRLVPKSEPTGSAVMPFRVDPSG